MIKINLLSPVDKDNLRWEKINSLAIKSVLWIFFFEALFAAAFLFSLEYLKAEESAVATELSGLQGQKEAQEMNAMEANLRVYKTEVDSLAAISKTRSSWTYLFENIANLVPGGVRLESIGVTAQPENSAKASRQTTSSVAAEDVAEGVAEGVAAPIAAPEKISIAITGKAKTREDLLTLEDNLKRSGLFSDLTYNDANYVKSVDIDFNYAFAIDSAKLLR